MVSIGSKRFGDFAKNLSVLLSSDLKLDSLSYYSLVSAALIGSSTVLVELVNGFFTLMWFILRAVSLRNGGERTYWMRTIKCSIMLMAEGIRLKIRLDFFQQEFERMSE